ncbi:hypothetical protein D3C80_2220170 [compost metagenome]
MHQRISDFINYRAVQLCFRPCNHEIDFFVQGFREIPNHPREAVKDGIYWHHPQLHNYVL